MVKRSLFDPSTLKQLDRGKENDYIACPRNSIINLYVSRSPRPGYRFLKWHNRPSPYRKRSHGNIPLLYFYIFSLFVLFSFISATGNSKEETEMETDVSQEKCLPSRSEATAGKSDSDMSELICHATCKNYSTNVSYFHFHISERFDSRGGDCLAQSSLITADNNRIRVTYSLQIWKALLEGKKKRWKKPWRGREKPTKQRWTGWS